MNRTNTRLLPFRSFDENDVINQFSLDQTGEYGQFVKVSRGDLDALDGQVADAFGGSFDRVTSPYWGVKNKITLCTSGDTKYDVLGLTLYSTLTEDENGEQLKFYRQKALELHAVISGESVPVIGKGLFDLGPDGYTVTGAAPNPLGVNSVQAAIGYLVVPSNLVDGKVDLVPSSAIVASPDEVDEYSADQVLGRVIGTGNMFGGAVRVQINI